eukprot:8507984-Pyramimonas_sp.AAC.1
MAIPELPRPSQGPRRASQAHATSTPGARHGELAAAQGPGRSWARQESSVAIPQLPRPSQCPPRASQAHATGFPSQGTPGARHGELAAAQGPGRSWARQERSVAIPKLPGPSQGLPRASQAHATVN